MAFFLAFLAMMVGVYAMPKGDIVFVIVEPNASADTVMQVIGRAGGYFVEGARFDWMAVAQSDDPHFTEKLLRAGALLVLNHELAVGCRLGATK